MIYKNVELHNIEEVTQVPGKDGVRLQRVPESVRVHLNEGAQWRMLQPDSAEIRFLADSPTTRITLSSEGETKATVFFGLFDGRQRFVIGAVPQTIEITYSENLAQLEHSLWDKMSFSPRVIRLILGGGQRDPLFFHKIEGKNVRPPGLNDVPAIRYLAYGTSITHGFDAEGPHLTYPSQTARLLGADVINLGVGGSAHCEPELADYIAGRKDWDIATLALSVNMIGFSLEEFSKRISYMVETIAGSNSTRPVACITLYPYFHDFGVKHPGISMVKPEEYRQALRDVVNASSCPNVHLLEGPELLTNISGLTADLIHPADNGMIEIGHNLAEKLKSEMKEQR